MSPTICCVVPAKRTSNRIADKNLREIDGVALYQRALELADSAEVFNAIWLSSDELSSADYNLHVRGPELLGDVPASAVARAVLADVYKSPHQWSEWLCLLQPTSPCLRVETLRAAAAICESDVDAVVATRAGERRPCGAFYFIRSYLAAKESNWKQLFNSLNALDRMVWYPIPDDEAIDVDCHADLKMANLVLAAREHFDLQES